MLANLSRRNNPYPATRQLPPRYQPQSPNQSQMLLLQQQAPITVIFPGSTATE